MATQTLSAADAILKDLYVGPIVEQLNQKTYLLDQLERDSDHIDHTGRRAVVPVHINRNYGHVSGADGATLPAAGVQAWQDAIIPIRYHYSGIEVTDAAIQATRSNEGAFINLLEAETKGVAQDLKKQINRQAFGNGDGRLATISGTPAGGTSITVDSAQYIKAGMVVDICRISDGQRQNGVHNTAVSAVNTSTNTITIGTATNGATANTYAVYLSSGFSPTTNATDVSISSRGNEMDGLKNIFGTTGRTLHSISSSTYPIWDPAQVLDASSGVIGESLFEQLADFVGGIGQGEVEVFLTTRGVKRRLADTYQSQKRFTDAQAVNVHGGYSAIMVNEVPVVSDDDAPKGWAFGFNKSSLKWFEQAKPGWLEVDNSAIFHLKNTTGGTNLPLSGGRQAIWQAYFRWYAALGCVAPNRGGAIKNGADDTALSF